MASNTIVALDDFGRFLVPRSIRKLFRTNRFSLRVENEEIRMVPVKTWGELFGSVPEINAKQLEKLRKEEAEYD